MISRTIVLYELYTAQYERALTQLFKIKIQFKACLQNPVAYAIVKRVWQAMKEDWAFGQISQRIRCTFQIICCQKRRLAALDDIKSTQVNFLCLFYLHIQNYPAHNSFREIQYFSCLFTDCLVDSTKILLFLREFIWSQLWVHYPQI